MLMLLSPTLLRLLSVWLSGASVASMNVVDSRYRAGALGFINVLAGLIGSLAPIGIGYLSQTYGNRGFEWGFASLGVSFVVAIAALLLAHFVTYKRDLKKKALAQA